VWHRIYLRWQQFFNYCIGGGFAFIVDAGLLFVFTEFCGLWYMLSATLSFLIAAVVNYSWQRLVTFRQLKSDKVMKQFLMFSLIAVVGLLINNSMLYILVEFCGFWYMLAKAAAAIVVLIWNFIANKKITFKYI